MDDALAWADDARALLDAVVAAQPFVGRISVAKQLRDAAERDARGRGETTVTRPRVLAASGGREPAHA